MISTICYIQYRHYDINQVDTINHCVEMCIEVANIKHLQFRKCNAEIKKNTDIRFKHATTTYSIHYVHKYDHKNV